MRAMQRAGAGAVVVVGVLAVAGAWGGGVARAEAAHADPPATRVEIEVTARGFVPDAIEVVAGQPVDLVFTRTTASGCAAQVQIPALGVQRTALPQGEPVTVRVAPRAPGTYEFACGMNMFKGTIRVMAAGQLSK
jgi:P-type Cu+ transporter